MAIPLALLAMLAARRGQSQNMQGLGGVDPQEFIGQPSPPTRLSNINDPLHRALQLRKGRDFSNLIFQSGLTPSLGMTALRTGVGALGSILKSKAGGGGGSGLRGRFLSSKGREDYA